MFAEALMLYRSGQEGRKQILSGGDKLFNAVAREDQLEIDETFGKASYIRGQDGKLLEVPAK
jgi:hypothetical protein